METELLEFFRKIGELTGDTEVGRGLVTCVGAVAVILTAGWRMLGCKKPSSGRVNVVVDAPSGETVTVQIGDRYEA